MRARAGVVALALLLAGCGADSGEPMKIDWDLSRSHTMNDVAWPDPSADSIELRPIASARIRFSDDREINETSAIRRVAVDREGQQIAELAIYSTPATVEDAYRLALRWCKLWKLPTTTIDEWHAGGGEHFNVAAYNPRQQLGPNHPEPSVKVLSSFDDDRPVIMSLQFFWPAETADGNSR
jgi:hypothetical protein